MKIPATLIREIYRERGNRGRPPSLRQIRAVEGYILANGAKTKSQVIREAGYPESRQNDTSKIFSRPILAVLDRLGITEELVSDVVKKNHNQIPQKTRLQCSSSKKELISSVKVPAK